MHTQGSYTSRRALPTLLCAASLCTAFALLSPSMALAQNIPVSFEPSGDDFTATDDDVTFNIRQCQSFFSNELAVQVTLDLSRVTLDPSSDQRYSIKLETASSACEEDLTSESTDCTILQDADDLTTTATSETTSVSTSFKDLFGLSSLEDCVNKSLTSNLVVVYEVTEIDTLGVVQDTETEIERFALNLSSQRPTGTPSGLSSSSGESSITLSFTAADPEPDDAEYIIYVVDIGAVGDPDNAQRVLTEGSAPESYSSNVRTVSASGRTEFTIDSGLSVNRAYQLAVVVADSNGNESVLSEVIEQITRPTDDFFEVYVKSGGTDLGGFCSVSSPASPTSPLSSSPCILFLLALGAFTLRSSSKRTRRASNTSKRSALLIATLLSSTLAIALLSSDVHAQTAPNLPAYDTSGQTSGTFELRFGSYLPDVDSKFGGDGPYSKVFGNESLLLAELSLSRNFGELAGDWAFAFDLGFMQAVGKSLDPNGSASPDTTVFNIIPLRAGVAWRIDLLQTYLSVPFVPVLKGGLDYSIWWVTDGAGDIASADGNEALGGTFGWHGAFALHFLLDSLDQHGAQNLLFDFGIQNSYLFAEYLYAKVDDFGSADSFDLSDDVFMFGFAFDY